MLYCSNVLKHSQNNDSEYSITELNKIATSNQQKKEIMENSKKTIADTPTENQAPNLIEFNTSYRNKNVTVHLEFPEQQNEKAAEDFISRLKNIYLKKIESKTMQLRESALQCISTNEKEDKNHG